MSGQNGNDAERSVLEVIKDIKEGTLQPSALSTQERRACVMHMIAEGVSIAEIAQILGRSERTIRRDRTAIHEENALAHDPKLAGVVAGRLASEADVCISRIRRVTRDRDAPHAVRVDGERACFQISDALAQRLQSLGFLPTAAARVEADLTHHVEEPPEYEDIAAEIQRLSALHQREGVETPIELVQLEDEVSRASLTRKVHLLASSNGGNRSTDGESDDRD